VLSIGEKNSRTRKDYRVAEPVTSMPNERGTPTSFGQHPKSSRRGLLQAFIYIRNKTPREQKPRAKDRPTSSLS